MVRYKDWTKISEKAANEGRNTEIPSESKVSLPGG